jgi:hypothetical protein
MSKTTGCIMKGFMWVVGIACLVGGIYYLMMDTSNWPQVDAVVTASKAGTTDDTGNTSYQTSFEYQVDGVVHEGYFNEYLQYTKGDKITVYYDPKNPNHTIQSQGELGSAGCIGVAFGLFCIGSMAWGAIKARRKTETP